MVIGLGRYVYQLNILCLPSAVCIFIWILADQIAVKISNPRLKFLKERLPSSYQSKLIKLLRVIAQRSTVRYCLLNYHATLIGAIAAFSADINSCPPPPPPPLQEILVIAGWGIFCEIALIWMSLDFTDDQSTLVQVMAWCRQATGHYLSQCWPRFLSPYGVTRPQWVKIKLHFEETSLRGFRIYRI